VAFSIMGRICRLLVVTGMALVVSVFRSATWRGGSGSGGRAKWPTQLLWHFTATSSLAAVE